MKVIIDFLTKERHILPKGLIPKGLIKRWCIYWIRGVCWIIIFCLLYHVAVVILAAMMGERNKKDGKR